MAVLLAPALSPEYDLTAALRAVSREMVVFWSPLDIFMLGMGTKVFGTADRVRTAGAGLVGFRALQRERNRTKTMTGRTTSYARFGGARAWRPRVTWGDILGRIVPYFSEIRGAVASGQSGERVLNRG